MNIEQLSYIVEVAKSYSLAKASSTLHISQSALSQAITRLEDELNLKIFNRTRTGAVLTKEGEKIIERAKIALRAIYEIKEEAHNQINNLNDFLRISTIPGLATPIIDTFLFFRNGASPLKIEVLEKGSMDIIADIQNDISDIGFIALNNQNIDLINELHFTPLLNGNILVFASKDSPLANEKIVSVETLKKQDFILYKDKYVNNFVNEFQNLFGPINVVLKTTDTKFINHAVANLGTVTIGHDISTICNQDFLMQNGRKIDLNGAIDTSFRFGWVYKKEYKLSWEAKNLIEEISDVFLKQHSLTL
ncbi:LysR family transcriptional regulator [Robertmurraya massiliosenegalensis]|uniref:LysR family transcriptional regulator n=1 Tax=Robertmurraya TaxID=2837507 RepID=UPI0039A6F570